MLPSGSSSIEEVASRLLMTKRSLQHRLGDESANYQHILNSARAELAQHCLANSPMSLGEISYLLGFLDSNLFNPGHLTAGWGKLPANADVR